MSGAGERAAAAGDRAATKAKGTARQAHGSETLDHLARAGLVAFGVVHLVLGWLALQLALGDREGSTSTSGAIQTLLEQPAGPVIVWAVALGMALLVVWQVLEALLGHRTYDGLDRVRKRVTSAGKAVVYAVIAVSAARKAAGDGGGGGEKQTDSMTAQVMGWPGGQLIVGAVGLGIVVVGGALVYKGVTDRFLRDLEAQGSAGDTGTAYTWLGRAGYTAKGVSLGVVGGLFCYAAATHDADEGGGLDQALRQVLEQPFGPVLLGAIGIGIACFGVFCFAWARHLSR